MSITSVQTTNADRWWCICGEVGPWYVRLNTAHTDTAVAAGRAVHMNNCNGERKNDDESNKPIFRLV